MRTAFIAALCALAARDERVLLLTGDLGFMALEPFRDRFPARFFNVGVAEQNMVAMATGLAEAGFRPFVYSIATFAALRAFEFIRNGPVLHSLPVRVVGMGMGFEYGHAGSTHHALEDIGALRTLPGLCCVIPADAAQAAAALAATADHDGPVYYSLGKDGRLRVPDLDGRFATGRAQIVGDGGDLAVVAMGSIAAEAGAAVEELRQVGVHATLAVVSGFNPDPVADLAALLRRVPHVVTVEAQTVSGGLGAFVGGVIATHGLACRLWPLAVHHSSDGLGGAQADLWRRHGLDRASIVAAARRALEASP